jgi:hypothetical protein
VRPVAALLPLALLLLACETADRRDAQSVTMAVARFRVADLPSTPAAVDALKKTPCATVDSCAARDTCAEAGDATARALVLKEEVGRTIAAVEAGTVAKDSPEARALEGKLDEAEALLKKGHDALPACDEKLDVIKRKYRL